MVRFPVIVTIFIAGCTSGSISNNAKVAGGSQTGGSSSSFSAGGSVHVGGSSSRGGSVPTGGTVVTGGNTSFGGSTGGSIPTGGITFTGGTTADAGIDVRVLPDGLPDGSLDSRLDAPLDTHGDTNPPQPDSFPDTYPDTTPDTPLPLTCTFAGTCYAYDCGPNVNESCCTKLIVYGGDFYRSYDGKDFTNKSYPAMINDFCLDKFEVTVGRFRIFVSSGSGTQASPPVVGSGAHPLITDSGWNSSWNALLPIDSLALKKSLKCDAIYQTWTDLSGGNENRPQNCVLWHEAFAFCAWDGGRLATESEFNYAASGGNEQRQYPWGTGLDVTRASYYVDSTEQCMGDMIYGCSINDLINVGMRPLGNAKWGHSDLAGNVRTWTMDYYLDLYPIPCNNCAVLGPTPYRTLRGGFFSNGDSGQLRSSARDYVTPNTRSATIGFRCAR